MTYKDYENYEFIEKDIVDKLIGVFVRAVARTNDKSKKRAFQNRIDELREEISDLYNNYSKEKAKKFEELYGTLLDEYEYNSALYLIKSPIDLTKITIKNSKKDIQKMIDERREAYKNNKEVQRINQLAEFETAYEVLNEYQAVCRMLCEKYRDDKELLAKLEKRSLQLIKEQQELKFEDYETTKKILEVYAPISNSYFKNPKEFKLTEEFFEAKAI